MKTKRQALTGKINIWATARTKHQIEQSDDGMPFELELDTTNYRYGDDIKIDTQEITVYSPEGVDLIGKALETLREQKVKKEKDLKEELEEIDMKIRNLLQLEYLPDEP